MIRTPLVRVMATATLVCGYAAGASAQTDLGQSSIEDLMRVEVQRVFGASDRLQPVTEAPSSITIVTADDIARYGYRSLADILRGVRGFYVSDDRNYSYVGVRGFSPPGDYNSKILLLLNGHRLNDDIYDEAAIGLDLGIDVAMFERVEIIRGPASGLYGTNAFFAVVNVITRDGGSLDGVSAAMDAGTLGTTMVRGSAGRRFANGVTAAVSATYEGSEGVKRLYFPTFDTAATNQGIADHLDRERSGQLYGQFRAGELAVTGIFGRRDKLVPTASFGTIFNAQSPAEQTQDVRTMVQAAYNHAVGRVRVFVDAGFDRYRYSGLYPFEATTPGVAVDVDDDGALGVKWNLSARATTTAPGQTITFGGEFVDNLHQDQWSHLTDPAARSFTLSASSTRRAVFGQDEVKVASWLILNGGLRTDSYASFTRTTPRAAVIVTPTANQSFKYLYGRAFRAPNAYEQYYYDSQLPGLRPESIATHEIVWEQYTSEWLRTSLSAYRYRASQLLALHSLGADATGDAYSFLNSDTSDAYGFEAEAEIRTKRGVQAVGSYAAQKATDGATNAPLTNSPRHLANARISIPGPRRGSFASVEWQFVGRRSTVAGAWVDPASLLNVTLSAPLSQSVSVVGGVRNLFDQRYSDPASDEQQFDAIPQNGRVWRAGLRWSLGARR